MDNLLVPERKANRKAQIKKKKPMKVVYISNPMKFKASASEFRALVQELTGQDAEWPDPTKVVVDMTDDGGVGGGRRMVPDDASKAADDDHDHDNHALEVSKQPEDIDCGLLDHPFDDDGDVYMPQMLENLSGLMPSSLFSESTHVDLLRGL